MSESLPLLAPNGSAFVWLWVTLIFLALLILSFGWMTFSAASSSVKVSETELSVPGVLGKKTFLLSDMQLDDAQIVDVAGDFQLTARTGGMGLPGFNLGWFRLKNGDTAYVYATHADRQLYIPIGKRKSLLLAFEDPERALRTLQAAG